MALLLLLCAIWGLTQVAIKVAAAGVPLLLQATIRSTGAAVLLVGWSALRGVPLWTRDGSLRYGVALAALFTVEFTLIYGGLAFTTASRAVLFLYTAPFVVAVGAHFMLPGEPLHRVKASGLACAFLGIALAFADGLRLPSRRELVGDSLELAAALLWGVTTLAVKVRGARLSPHKTLLYQLGGSAAPLGAIALATGSAGITRLDALTVACLAYQIVITAFASYLGWFWVLSRYPASPVAAFSFWTPIFGLLAGWLLLGDPVTPALVIAIALVALGIFLVNWDDGEPRRGVSPPAGRSRGGAPSRSPRRAPPAVPREAPSPPTPVPARPSRRS
jgi:drug/metabolite transporter (DMT)-like permease